MIIFGYQGVKTGVRINQIIGTVNIDEEDGAVQRYVTDDKVIGLFSVEDGREYHSVNYKKMLSNERFLKLTV